MARKGQKSGVRRKRASLIKPGMTILGHTGKELYVKDVQPHADGGSVSIITRELGGMFFSSKSMIKLAA
jgi:hypothetical protein